MFNFNISKAIDNSKSFWSVLFIAIATLQLFSISIQQTIAQDISFDSNTIVEEEKYIQWIGQYPADADNTKHDNFFKKLGELITGAKPVPALIRPVAVIAINPDTFKIIDQGNRIILEIQNHKSELPKFFKNNSSNFSSLVGICTTPDNTFVFTDSRSNKIYEFESGKNDLRVILDSLLQPTGIAYSKMKDEILVVETAAHRISVLNRNGTLIKTIGHRGEGKGEFNFPTYIWIDEAGFVYVNDAMNFRVQIFDSNGTFVSTFGKPGDATGYFASSKGIATDSHHNIYVVDALFHTVQIFDTDGNFLYNFGEQGTGNAQFWMPSGIYIDNKDFIYVADSYNSRIQIFQLTKSDTK